MLSTVKFGYSEEATKFPNLKFFTGVTKPRDILSVSFCMLFYSK